MNNKQDIELSDFYEHCYGTATYKHIIRDECDSCTIENKCRKQHEKNIADEMKELKAAKQKRLNSVGLCGNTSECSNDETKSITIKVGVHEWSYLFPDFEGEVTESSTADLIVNLEELVENPEYLSIRGKYCSVQQELNMRYADGEEGVKSLRFRPQRLIPPKFGKQEYSMAESFLSNDKQVIAMHSHHCLGRRDVYSDDKLAKKTYDGGVFDTKAASEFVVVRGGGALKAKLIGLDRIERWESGSFDGQVMTKQWKVIKAAVKKSKKRLKALSRRHPHIEKSVDVWSDLLMAMLIESDCIASTEDLLPLQVSKMYKSITGQEMSRQSARSKIKSIKSHLPDWKNGLNES